MDFGQYILGTQLIGQEQKFKRIILANIGVILIGMILVVWFMMKIQKLTNK